MNSKIKCNNSFTLCEGCVWDDKEGVFWGVDIDSMLIWKTSSDQSRIESIYELNQKVGWCFPEIDTGLLITGQKDGIYCLKSSTLEVIRKIDIPGLGNDLRLNDAIVDSIGAIWGGVMHESTLAGDVSKGFLYRIAKDGEFRVIDEGYVIPNGPAISPDERFMLHTDSFRKTVYIFDLNVQLGIVANKRIWKVVDDYHGSPDGMVFDASGNVWIAFWGGSSVKCFDIKGRLLKEVFFPAKYITNVCFGGADLQIMLVTTAKNRNAEFTFNNKFDGKIYEVHGHEAVGINSRYPVKISGNSDANY